MSAHVAPHRWADAAAGKLRDRERAAMERHAGDCTRCAAARARVESASQSFPSLRAQTAPELSWDTLKARIHWSISSERRRRSRQAHEREQRVGPIIVWTGVVVGGLALGLATGSLRPPRVRKHPPAVVATAAPAPAPAPAPAAIRALVSRLAGDVMIDGVRRDDAFARVLGAGTVLATGDGRVDVQFGEHSAFALGPKSTLELRHFDATAIELAVEGTVDIEVAPRAPGQVFRVLAGDHTIEVRGTQFRVSHDPSGTRIACRHGLVAVRDAAGEIEVATARKLALATGQPLSGVRATVLTTDEIGELVAATPVVTPLWTDATITADALAHSSTSLEVATSGRREVRVDGVEVGAAPLRVRVAPGRHTVEAADSAGRFRRAGWVDVDAAHPARLEVRADPPPTGGVPERRRALRAGLDRARLARCTRAIAKAGLTDTYVHIEIAVDASGAVSFLNILDTDLPSATAACVRDALADIRFAAGPAATWREKIEL